MEHIIAKTGLGVAISHVIEELQLEANRDSIKALLIDVFTSKFQEFKKRHAAEFPSTTLVAFYIVENQYPVGQNDMHQYFRCLANEVKVGNGALSIGAKEERKNFTIIQGYSRNETLKKRVVSKVMKSGVSKSSKDQSVGYMDAKPQKRQPSKSLPRNFVKKKKEEGFWMKN